MNTRQYTCPCCGYQPFDEPPGSYQICHVCFWEDDAVQLLDPWFPGGANRPNLADAQQTYSRCGATEERFLKNIKGVQPTDVRDPTWRRVVQQDRQFVTTPRHLSAGPMDLNVWYYWRRSA